MPGGQLRLSVMQRCTQTRASAGGTLWLVESSGSVRRTGRARADAEADGEGRSRTYDHADSYMARGTTSRPC